MILLTSARDQGSCYVETSAIDGETNLKLRSSVSVWGPLEENMPLSTESITPDEFAKKIAATQIEISAEPPNASVNTFSGSMSVEGERVPLGSENLLVRGR